MYLIIIKKMRRPQVWKTVLFFVGWIVCLHSERLDTLDPIIRKSPAISVNSDDFFGYAIVLHQIEVPATGNFTESLSVSRIIVGAPKGTFPGGLNYTDIGEPAVNTTGLVYLCPVLNGSCEGLLGNGMGYDRKLFDEDPNTNGAIWGNPAVTLEDKERQFMGASMASTGDRFVVCAPLWANTYGHISYMVDYRPQGRCYYSPRSLTDFYIIQTCNGGTITSNDGDSQCTAGIAVAILPPSQNGTVVLGAPGHSGGYGALFYTTAPMNNAMSTIITLTNFSYFIAGPVITPSIYQGYALTTGNILSRDKEYVITTYHQFVNTTLHERLQFYDAEDLMAQFQTLPTGSSPTEYFGYSIATADLNGDGWDEVIAGAPLYSTPTMLESGQIYVFANNGGTFTSAANVVIPGTVVSGRFGHAIVNLGDINGDNCEDVAVSAPFASTNASSASSGVVYIYLGSNATLLNTTPVQILVATDVMNANALSELRSFGYSMASGVDVDGNMYNDLAVGALYSQTVVLFRTLSIATVNVTLNAPSDVSTAVQNCSGYSCFTVNVCASYTGRGLSGPLGVSFVVREVLDAQTKRLFFGTPAGKLDSYVGLFQFQSNGSVYCYSVVSYIDSTAAATTSHPFQVEALFPTPPRNASARGSQPLLDLRQYPEIDVVGTTVTQVNIRKNCNTTSLCYPDLSLNFSQIAYSPSPNLVADLTKSISVTVICRNGKDDAFGSTLTATFPSYLKITVPTGLPTCTVCWNCSSLSNTTTSCTSEPFLLRTLESIAVGITWTVVTPLLGNEKFNISISVSVPNDINTSNNVVTVPVAATASADLSVELTLNPTSLQYSLGANSSALETISLSDFGSKPSLLTVSFFNKGPSTIQNLLVDMYYPYQSADTGRFFYLYGGPAGNEFHSAGIHVNCSGDNPRGFTATPPQGRRRSAERSPISLAQWWLNQASSHLLKKRAVVAPPVTSGIVNCSDVAQRSLQCGHVNCTVQYLPSVGSENLFITLPLYVDDRYFAIKKGNYSLVVSVQTTILDSYIQDVAFTSAKTLSSSLLLSPSPIVETIATSAPIPWYLIVFPVIGGLLFIIVIGCILYFCGFLRRKRLIPPDEDQAQSPNGAPHPEAKPRTPKVEEVSSPSVDSPTADESQI